MNTEEHDQTPADSTGSANQGDSQGAGASISLDEATVKALLDNPLVTDRLTQIAQKSSQSVKDRRIAGLEKDVQELISRLDLTPEQQRQYKSIQQEKLLEQLQEKVFGSQDQAAGTANTQPGQQLDIVSSLQSAGYNINAVSAEDIAFVESFKGSQAELTNALLKRRVGSMGNAPAASAAGVMPVSQGLPTAAAGSQEALQAEYNKRIAALPPGSIDQIFALKKEFRDKGLNIF